MFLNVLCILIEFPSLINGFQFLCILASIVAIEYPFTLIDLHIIVIEFRFVFVKVKNYLNDLPFTLNEGQMV